MKLKEFVKEGFYINLDYKTERDRLTIQELKKYSLDSFVKRYPAVKAFEKTVECEYGSPEWAKCFNCCAQSHLNIIKYAKEKKLEKILIFEDDIQFYQDDGIDPIQTIENSLDSLCKIKDWQIIYLGGFLGQDSSIQHVDQNLIKMKLNSYGKINGTILSTHAYILHERAYETLLNYNNTPFDLFMSGVLSQVYLTYPCMVVQRGLDTNDIGGKQTVSYKSYFNSYLSNYKKEQSYIDISEYKKYFNKKINFDNFEINLDKNFINQIDFSKLIKFLVSENDKYHFNMNCGQEHYKILSYFSSIFNNNILLDIGTNTGSSALALSHNPKNKVISFDIDNKLKLKNDKRNIKFIIDDILCDDKYLEIIKNSPFIMVDVNHDGIFENKFHKKLQDINWKGILFLDDINLNDEMRRYWEGISEKKHDLTEYGHWSGSGLVVFE